ncbi:hypothetical protein FSP39_004860 [Pinctada imbricata]|uniref:Uncharacterized protein n=1 Tax=Pinctada imbricata TaxID=66713 RepID=A0AA89BNM2_PINIB|nr:hypothetical protein FSP39_004860 [Pinctada imbricata]
MALAGVELSVNEDFNVLDKAGRSKRSQAVPKHTLFGTTLEVHDDEEMKQIQNIDLSVQQISSGRKPKDRYVLPEFIQNHLKGNELVIQRTKKDIEKQKEAVTRARQSLQEAEKRSKEFGMDTYLGKREGDPTPRMKALMSTEASNTLKQMNHIGLNERNSYNRDKYGNKPPTHPYSLMGDVMQPRSMDLPRRREHEEVKLKKKEIEEVLPLGVSPRRASAQEKERLAIDLPDNIRHQFGSGICKSLLSDPKLVNKTLEHHRLQEEKANKVKSKEKIPKIDKELNPEYESLGNFTRMNMFPGYNINHKISTTKSTFTDDVHLRRIPDPDQWRMQRDDLSQWAEFNILNERMKKRWNEYLDNVPKAEANWNRSAKRQRPEPAVQQKPKSTKRPQQIKPKEQEKPAFEEVKFVTPPVTPPPQGGKVQLAPKASKDEEFWKFYDQGGKG